MPFVRPVSAILLYLNKISFLFNTNWWISPSWTNKQTKNSHHHQLQFRLLAKTSLSKCLVISEENSHYLNHLYQPYFSWPLFSFAKLYFEIRNLDFEPQLFKQHDTFFLIFSFEFVNWSIGWNVCIFRLGTPLQLNISQMDHFMER